MEHTWLEDEKERIVDHPVKKHSVFGIVSSVFVLITSIISVILLVIFLFGVNDLKGLFDEIGYTFEDIMIDPETVIDNVYLTSDQEEILIKGFMKMGVSYVIFIVTSVGYLVGLILGIIGVCDGNRKKLFAILGLILCVVSPLTVFLIGYNTMLHQLF